MARGGEPGGSFEWKPDPDNDIAFSSVGDRAYLRLDQYKTTSVTVTHQSLFGSRCEAVLRVIMQDGYPTEELF